MSEEIKKYEIELKDWKEVPIQFSGISAKTIQKIIDLCWKEYDRTYLDKEDETEKKV